MSSEYILILGLPGSGKGTLAQRLVERFNCIHISCGDVFREQIRLKTEFGLKALEYIERGQLTPDDETSRMFLAHLASQPNSMNYLLEGYPRTRGQALDFETHLSIAGRALTGIICLDANRETLLKRVIQRRVCRACGAIYNLVSAPPLRPGVCDRDGSSLVQRADDMPDVAPARLQLYEEKENEVLSHFRKKMKVDVVDADAPQERVAANVAKLLASRLMPRT